MIAFACPHCGKNYNVQDRLGGQETACAACRGRLIVPDAPVEVEQPVVRVRRPAAEPLAEPLPWYYAVLRIFAYCWAGLGILGIAILFWWQLTYLNAERQAEAITPMSYTRGVVILVVACLLGLFLSLVLPAVLLIFADIGRTLRQIRRQR